MQQPKGSAVPASSKSPESVALKLLEASSSEPGSAESALPGLDQILASNPGWLDEAIDTIEASRITGRPVSTLETLRVRGGGPLFIQQPGSRAVRYRRRDLFAWTAAGLRTSTAGRVARRNTEKKSINTS
jgi:hypothetical protein